MRWIVIVLLALAFTGTALAAPPGALNASCAMPPSDAAPLKAGKYTGKVKWFNSNAGCGAITPDNGAADVFVHWTAIRMEGFRSLKETDRVSFDAVIGPKGVSAGNVRLLP